MRHWWIIIGLFAALLSAWGQNRPTILWRVGHGVPIGTHAVTESGDYLMANGYAGLDYTSLWRTDWVLNQPPGRGLVDTSPNNYAPAFTDACDAPNGPEYLLLTYHLAFSSRYLVVRRLVRGSSSYSGAIPSLYSGVFNAPHNICAFTPLRGNVNSRTLNRLVAVGTEAGELLLVSIQEPSAGTIQLVQEARTPAHSAALTAIAYDPSTRRIVTSGQDGLVRVWQLSGSLGSLTLSNVANLGNGFDIVDSVGFATNSSNQRLLITATKYSFRITAYNWNNGSPTPVPVWNTYIDPRRFGGWGATELRVGDGSPIGMVAVSAYTMDEQARGSILLLNPDTGELEYLLPAPFSWAHHLSYTMNNNSPLFFRYAGNTYCVDALGLRPISLSRRQQIGSPYSAAATAVQERGGFLAVGYADGLIRLYRGQTVVASNATEHQGARIVKLFWIGSGSAQQLISVDSLGRLRAWNLSLTRIAQLDLNYELEGADIRDDRFLAVIGQAAGTSAGAPKASIVSYDGGTFSRLSDFTPYGNAPGQSIAFDVDGSIWAKTYTHLSQWSSDYTAPTQLYAHDIEDGDGVIAVNRGTGRLVMSQFLPGQYAVLGVYRRPPGNPLIGKGLNSTDAARSILPVGRGNAVLLGDTDDLAVGTSFSLPGGAYYHFVARGDFYAGNLHNDTNTVYFAYSVRVVVPDEPLSIARDSANGNLFYIACADGSVVQATLPALQRFPLGFERLNWAADVHDTGVVSQAGNLDLESDWGTGYGNGYFFQTLNLFDLTNGSRRTFAPVGRAWNAPYVRLSPQGGVAFTQAGNTLGLWNLPALTPLLTYTVPLTPPETAFLNFVPLSNSQVAILRSYTTGVQVGNNPTQGLRISLGQVSGNTLNETNHFDLVSNNQPVHLRCGDTAHYAPIWSWSVQYLAFNSDGTRMAVLGVRLEPQAQNPCSTIQNISIWRRSPNSWNWTLERTMQPSSDYIGGAVSVQFHPSVPQLFYVGTDQGKLWRYDLQQYVPNPNDPATAQGVVVYSPSLGNPGAVTSMNIGEFRTDTGLTYTILAFGGGNGISVWATSACRAGALREVAFYRDGETSYTWIRLRQPQGNFNEINLFYGDARHITAAKINAPTVSFCPEDTNGDGLVDDLDLSAVLFNFGAVNCACPADINCDGIVDDADLSLVLFAFGRQC